MATKASLTNKTTIVKLESPRQVSDFAKELKKFVVANKLYTEIKGKNFVHVEGWQFAGAATGHTFIPTSVEDLSTDGEIKYRSSVDMIRLSDGAIIGRGFAICSNKESKKRSFEEYAISSMAQTRAIGKAGRNTLGWVMKLAGYESTPSEEAVAQEPEVFQKDELPIVDVKFLVSTKLATMKAQDKVRLLKDETGQITENKLTDDNYRRLYLVLSEVKND